MSIHVQLHCDEPTNQPVRKITAPRKVEAGQIYFPATTLLTQQHDIRLTLPHLQASPGRDPTDFRVPMGISTSVPEL